MKQNRVIIFLATILVIDLLVLVVAGVVSFNDTKELSVQSVTDGWVVETEGKIYKNAKLQDVDMENTDRKACYTLIGHIEETSYTNTVLMVELSLCEIEIYCGSQQIYGYGKADVLADRIVGSANHMVSLPTGYGEKEIKIVITLGEDKAITSLPEVKIANGDTVQVETISRYILNTIISIAIIGLGIVLIFIGIYAVCINKEYARILYIGFFSGSIGIWAICYDYSIQLFSNNYKLTTCLEYAGLYFATIPMMKLISDVKKDTTGVRKMILKVATKSITTFAMFALFLQMTNLVHFPELLGVFHLLSGVMLVLTLWAVLTDNEKMDRSGRIFFTGIITMFVAFMIDLLRFNIFKYILEDVTWLKISVVPIGTLCMVVLMIVSYVYYLFGVIETKTKQDMLVFQAYNDALTGLYNRNKAEETFDMLLGSDTKYAIINYDLNDLKVTNDTLGHKYGDKMIMAFAEVLKDSFEDGGIIVRMGGDEFIVIVKNVVKEKLDKYIRNYERLMNKSKILYGVSLSASYGIAYNTEKFEDVSTPEKVYSLADARMYEMKKKTKDTVR